MRPWGRRRRRCPRRAGSARAPEPNGQLRLEPLGTRTEPGDLGGATHRAERRRLRGEPAVVAVEAPVPVEHEGDVAVRAAGRMPARSAVQRGRDPAAVEQEDRPPPGLGDAAQLGQQRRRQRVAALAAQIDDAHRGQPPSQALPELEALKPRPALRTGRGAAEHADGMLERSASYRHGSGVVPRVGVLLVGGIVLLVDADDAEPGHGGEDRRAGPDDHRRVPGGDALALVTALGFVSPEWSRRPGRRTGPGNGRRPAR